MTTPNSYHCHTAVWDLKERAPEVGAAAMASVRADTCNLPSRKHHLERCVGKRLCEVMSDRANLVMSDRANGLKGERGDDNVATLL